MTMMPYPLWRCHSLSPVITFIKHIKQRKRLYESQRLLYLPLPVQTNINVDATHSLKKGPGLMPFKS